MWNGHSSFPVAFPLAQQGTVQYISFSCPTSLAWERQAWRLRAVVSRPTLLIDMLSCSSWIEDLFEGREWEGMKSSSDGFGGYREEGACLANVDLAKCSHCFCLVSPPWAERQGLHGSYAALEASHAVIPQLLPHCQHSPS